MATRRFGARPSNQIDNLEAVDAPDANDDVDLGYGVDSIWVDTVLNVSYICTDATADNAVWEPVTGAGGGGHTIQDEGGAGLTARTNLNFVGAGVAATDGGAGPDSTIVTIPIQKLDDCAAPDNNTDLNASTTAHGLAPLVVDPASAVQRHVLCTDNGETVRKDADLFDATHPEAIGTATEGTSLLASHRDHVHAADSDDVAYISTTAADWDGAADPGDVEQALDQLAERQRNAFVFIPASVMWPSTGTGALLDGCAWPARREFTTNGVNLYYCAFDTTTSEAAEFSVVLPVWDGGTVTATVHFTTVLDTGADKTVNWEVQAQSYDTLEAIDTAWGTSQTAAATVPDNKQDTVIEVACDTAITVATTPSYLNLVHFRIYRDVANDNLAADADLLGVTIGYNRRDA
jgi:hypothetical protein